MEPGTTALRQCLTRRWVVEQRLYQVGEPIDSGLQPGLVANGVHEGDVWLGQPPVDEVEEQLPRW